MLNKIYELNDTFFRLYGDIRENTENLSPKQYSFMQEKLFEQYKLEYSKLALEKEISDKNEIIALKMRISGYTPSSFLFFKNKAYSLLRKQISKELDEYFTSNFNKLKEILPVQEPGVAPTEEPAKDNKGEKR